MFIKRRTRGVSLIELIIVLAVASIMLGAIFDMFRLGGAQYEPTHASLHAQGDVFQALRWLERDLSETSVQTFRGFPSAASPSEPAGLSIESARTLDGDVLAMSDFGVVRWQKYVYYTLSDGVLVRKEGVLTDNPSPIDVSRMVPMASGSTPSGAPGIARLQRVAARNVKSFRAYNLATNPVPIYVDITFSSASSRTGKITEMSYHLQVRPRN